MSLWCATGIMRLWCSVGISIEGVISFSPMLGLLRREWQVSVCGIWRGGCCESEV